MKLKTRVVLAAALSGIAGSALAASETEELRALVKQLQARLDQVEAKQAVPAPAAAPLPANVVTSGDLPGSFKIPGTDTSLKIYGLARLDMTHDLKGRTSSINDWDWASAIYVQPFDNASTGKSSKGQTYMTGRVSRIGFMTSTPTDSAPLLVKVEGDFNSPNQFYGELATNSMNFRLRHAYGEKGNLLVGQTWSNFSDLGSFPDTVDFNTVGSAAQIRQPQIRYSIPMGASKLSLSVENPQSLSLPTTAGAADFDKTPDFIANWTMSGARGHVSLRAVSLDYRNDNHAKRGYGLGLGGSLKLGDDLLVAGIQGGEGIGRYMLDSIVQGAIDDGSGIRLWKAYSWHVGYTHAWSAQVRSNLIASQAYFSKDDVANTAQRALGSADLYPNRRIDQAYLNTFWGLGKNTEFGIEYAWGKRTTFNHEIGTQSRINAMLSYNFN